MFSVTHPELLGLESSWQYLLWYSRSSEESSGLVWNKCESQNWTRSGAATAWSWRPLGRESEEHQAGLHPGQAQSVAVSENEFKGCYSIILSLHFRWLAWPVHSTSAMILLSLLGFSYRMVARLCYDFTTKQGAWTTSLTVSISTRSEQAGIAGEAGCTHNQQKVLFQVVRHGKDNIHGKITFRKPTRILSLDVLCWLHSWWW